MITVPTPLWKSLPSCTKCVCDLCGNLVEGLFYRCKLCKFNAHTLCTQLPEYVRHVMHTDNPLRLQ
ncbi:hypothetical protein Goklo_002824 [Gossypium klotzschianum]|uniref:DC1 domain-containing protein n=1 Tax=Gossypium klotzschianum TaxID=34286 RepID=A0A7J8VV07_9ROSI|nr:hypothetical protein [Gossypium klotzschianum]